MINCAVVIVTRHSVIVDWRRRAFVRLLVQVGNATMQDWLIFFLQFMVHRYTDEKLGQYDLQTEGEYVPVSAAQIKSILRPIGLFKEVIN